jgi:hypothetical protein
MIFSPFSKKLLCYEMPSEEMLRRIENCILSQAGRRKNLTGEVEANNFTFTEKRNLTGGQPLLTKGKVQARKAHSKVELNFAMAPLADH